MQITIIGAGAMGSAIALDLAAREDVDLVRVCDTHSRPLRALGSLVKHGKVRSFQVDARDAQALAPVLTGTDCVVGAMGPDLSPMLARLAIDTKAHYCDLGGGDEVLRAELALASRATDAGTWVVPSCGLAPGLINVLCLMGVNQFDDVESALLRVGDLPIYPEPPFNFRVAWSADKILDDYTNPVTRIENGEVIQCEPLTRDEQITFDEPFNQLEAFCTAGSLSLLANELEGRVRQLDHKTIRWPGHASQMRFMLGLGLADPLSIDVRTHLTYRDVLARRMRQRLGGEHEDAVLLRVVIHGTKDGRQQSLVYEMIDRFDPEYGVSAMRRCTAFPAAAVAYLLASGQVPGGGAAPPEMSIPHAAFLEQVRSRGLDISESWHDGFVPVSNPAA